MNTSRLLAASIAVWGSRSRVSECYRIYHLVNLKPTLFLETLVEVLSRQFQASAGCQPCYEFINIVPWLSYSFTSVFHDRSIIIYRRVWFQDVDRIARALKRTPWPCFVTQQPSVAASQLQGQVIRESPLA